MLRLGDAAKIPTNNASLSVNFSLSLLEGMRLQTRFGFSRPSRRLKGWSATGQTRQGPNTRRSGSEGPSG